MRNVDKGFMTAVAISALACALSAHPALAADATQASAGTRSDGTEVQAVTLKAANGVSATILTYGATLWKLMAPDRNGKVADVLVAYGDLAAFEKKPNFWGATIGRYGNRIAGGKFTLDGKTYQLPQNDHGQSLHGGGKGFDVQNWKLESVKSGKVAKAVFSLVSPDGDSGYPGTVKVTATYSLDESGNLQIVFDATTDKPTVLNLTNHALFNMAGEGSERDATTNVLTIPASRYTPVDDKLIPTGELRAVAGGPFDFTKPKAVAVGLRNGRDQQIVYGRGFDHNFALDKGQTSTPRLSARLEDPVSGRVLEVLSTEPGVQFYSGNFLDGTLVGKQGHLYRMGDGIALEPQKFPDGPNHPDFPSTRVDPGKPYRHVMIYRVTTSPR
ncbi:aldose epimerase family protein [Novosphingobium sp. Leaf2]|uniref:aldose epimerase family protein n=1 Tax=Novosphingobium sp. Leaf2 TaxID=1735670 RepID=UPI00070117E4|nr:aldose epimerase family protein [Novosphingobium sp. Leaf2]KQM13387.1 aldose epimerase [Novosphingobium sp. Leaf2]